MPPGIPALSPPQSFARTVDLFSGNSSSRASGHRWAEATGTRTSGQLGEGLAATVGTDPDGRRLPTSVFGSCLLGALSLGTHSDSLPESRRRSRKKGFHLRQTAGVGSAWGWRGREEQGSSWGPMLGQDSPG